MMGGGVLIAREGKRSSTVVLSSHAIERGESGTTEEETKA